MFGKRKKNEIPPDTVQQTIPFDRMWKDGVCRVGEGVAVSFMDGASIRNRDLYKKLCALAEENSIAWQVKKFISGSNDAGSLQRNNGARATCVLSVPCRYIHSGSNVACFHDIDAQYQLVDAYLTAGGAF